MPTNEYAQTIAYLTDTIRSMADRIRKLESQESHYDQQIQHIVLPVYAQMVLKDDRQLVVYDSYTIDGDVVLAGGEIVILHYEIYGNSCWKTDWKCGRCSPDAAEPRLRYDVLGE